MIYRLKSCWDESNNNIQRYHTCRHVNQIIYADLRRTVVASTIPHLREDRMKEIQIPILDKETIGEITNLVREAFKLKAERKRLIAEVRKTIDSYFDI